MILENGIALVGILQFHPLFSLAHPIEKELCRCFTDSIWLALEFDIEWRRRGKTKGVWNIYNNPHKKPAWLAKFYRVQSKSAVRGRVRHTSDYFAIPDDLDQAFRITRSQR